MAVNEVKKSDGTILMSVVEDTVTEKALLEGYTATASDGAKITGILTISNPNILINSDFSINQRGKTLYNTADYTVDCWELQKISSASAIGTVAVSGTGITLTSNSEVQSVRFLQKLEKEIPEGQTVTMSVYVEEISGSWSMSQFGGNGKATITTTGWNTLTTEWTYLNSSSRNTVIIYNNNEGTIKMSKIKLEYGGASTTFVPPNLSLELLKCQRYYQIRSTGDIKPVDLRPSMRVSPTVTALGSGTYSYSAEL